MWNWNWVGHYSLLFFLLGLYFMLHKKKHQFWVGWLTDRRQLLIFMCNSILLEIMSRLTSSPHKINDKVILCNHSLHYCNVTVSEKQFEVWLVKRIILCKKCDSGLVVKMLSRSSSLHKLSYVNVVLCYMKSFLVPLFSLKTSWEPSQCNCSWPNFQALKLTCYKCNRVREGLDRYKGCLLTGILFEVVITDSEFELISDPSEICLACRLNEMNVCKTESTHDTWYIAAQNIK